MFSKVAVLIDRKPLRLALAAVGIGCTLLLGPFVIVLLAIGIREPGLFALGLGGALGLLGAFFRIGGGPRFFSLTSWERRGIATCIASGIASTFLAPFALPGNLYWSFLPCLGVVGLLLLAGSIKGPAAGSNHSFKVTPDGAPQLNR